MTHPENGGALAVISASLGKVESAVEKVAAEQSSQREYLARFDERQRGWATKHEVGELVVSLRSDMNKVEAKAERALVRTDEHSTTLGAINSTLVKMQQDMSGLRSDFNTKQAEVRGAWAVVRPGAAWLFGIAAVVVAAFFVGHLT